MSRDSNPMQTISDRLAPYVGKQVMIITEENHNLVQGDSRVTETTLRLGVLARSPVAEDLTLTLPMARDYLTRIVSGPYSAPVSFGTYDAKLTDNPWSSLQSPMRIHFSNALPTVYVGEDEVSKVFKDKDGKVIGPSYYLALNMLNLPIPYDFLEAYKEAIIPVTKDLLENITQLSAEIKSFERSKGKLRKESSVDSNIRKAKDEIISELRRARRLQIPNLDLVVNHGDITMKVIQALQPYFDAYKV
ncbi:hypothetical protein J4405_00730 [Candidatus Woesearchaeota archaeon]|nr:hypothetical protein [Candidatus Woesearchaeota archaeon]